MVFKAHLVFSSTGLLMSFAHVWSCRLPACLQAGLVKAAAASGSVSAKARRKRKQQQQQAGPPGAAAAAVAWANRRLQQREYQAAWLALLRTDLPGDIYKKVGGVCVELFVLQARGGSWPRTRGCYRHRPGSRRSSQGVPSNVALLTHPLAPSPPARILHTRPPPHTHRCC